jgi:hypothetical protein
MRATIILRILTIYSEALHDVNAESRLMPIFIYSEVLHHDVNAEVPPRADITIGSWQSHHRGLEDSQSAKPTCKQCHFTSSRDVSIASSRDVYIYRYTYFDMSSGVIV